MKRYQALLAAATCSIMLSGCAAALVGATAVGISAATDSRSLGTQLDDQTIELRVIRKLKGDSRLDDTRIQVVAFNRSVLLLGQVSDSSLYDLVNHLVRNTEGVSKVHNELRIAPVIDVAQISKDTWITSKIKAQLVADENVKAVHIKVITENNEVALMGLVSPEQARQAIDIARNVSGVTQVIDAFQ
ncbi:MULTISPECIES: division/outer membrane stress-associated lipid-binding lipoprotein [Idiomarinaceae]|uniref:Osmotically-inducible protein OsmY n=3 Tax=Pseudidiomarina TaxID=2800384 RepID=A0A368UTL3_9GAMM|nr:MULTISPECIES: division/outer membrane stress-associated lipid-binding lipoprotein [Idiomarinaceae]MDT7525926.1 division/outer membrane stress-associated lipid-binding lipoprotein [Pseudidiomarina sp. GXY010]MRJ41990.1 divisome-associated lipoprotein YraP [Idiomarina sp. FeN1]NCU57273.1 divisome-associated lipoprotein YraP [Idiomarina sp. FenA--70]NCU59981.1 divisome-associated lipoprotein YraP [Idiomarina sp. FenBw--71]PWW13020.1 osmotically-inducible protein OsmY [Pseudidiomarina maritima]